MKKIITRLKGGLGNQLFCYAAARRLALINNAELIIDDVTGFARDHQYFRQYVLDHFKISARKATPMERLEPFERYQRAIMKLSSRLKPFSQRRYIEQAGIEFDPRLLGFKVNGTVYLDGYWQDENYFKDVADILKKDLRIIEPIDADNKDMAEQIRSCNSVCVHLRWFDKAEKEGSLHNIEQSYYKSAIQEINNIVPAPHLFVFSDDPEAARSRLAFYSGKIIFVDNNKGGDSSAYADLWLMTLCKHLIIANSTFSWWGAWLNENTSKVVVAPSKQRVAANNVYAVPLPESWRQV
ncbi:MAG: alpha-1,2-fucosyltransferase [Proteobacteria bacterium]|nr:alpha-1,2-fucosyltransferase [Pseudomonadota bacterium]